jgi:chemotaxis protein MotA
MEKGTVIGLPVAFLCVFVGGVLEGMAIKAVYGPIALMIVLGGSLGACLVEFSWETSMKALKMFKLGFTGAHHDYKSLVDQILKLAGIARKDGLLALEKEREAIEDAMLKDALKFAIDGLEPTVVQGILEARISHRSHEAGLAAKFWSQVGAYCPTVGIIGAVMGLIIVMNNLDKPELIGPGIAVAFIATIYGVALSNLVFMPLGNKLKVMVQHEELYYEMIKVGVRNIQQGTSPAIIESQLYAIIDENPAEEGAA